MDKEVKDFLRFCTLPGTVRVHTSLILFKEKWSISVDETNVTHTERKNLYIKIYGRRILEYWNKKDSVLMDPEQIDWESSRQTMRIELKRKRRVDIKLLCDQCRLNKILYNRQEQNDHQCLLWDKDREDRNHPFTCPHSKVTKVYLKSQKKLAEKKQRNFKQILS